MALIPTGEPGKVLQWYDSGGGVMALRNRTLSDLLDEIAATGPTANKYYLDISATSVAPFANALAGTGALADLLLHGGAGVLATALQGTGTAAAVSAAAGSSFVAAAAPLVGTGTLAQISLTQSASALATAITGTGAIAPVAAAGTLRADATAQAGVGTAAPVAASGGAITGAAAASGSGAAAALTVTTPASGPALAQPSVFASPAVNGGGTASATLTPTAVGNLLFFVALGTDSDTAWTVADDHAHTWNTAALTTYDLNSARYMQAWWTVANTTSPVTATLTGDAWFSHAVALTEFSGVRVFDTAHSAATLGTDPLTSGAITTAQAVEVLVGVAAGGGTQVPTLTQGTGWTKLGQITIGLYALALQYRVTSSAGSYESTWTIDPTQNSDHMIVAFAPPDTAAPSVSAFTVGSPTGLTVPVTAFTATDNVAVTGYMITTSSTPPASGAAGWAGTAPTSWSAALSGTYSLYPWAKDAAGNVSSVFGTPRSVTVLGVADPVAGSVFSGTVNDGATFNAPMPAGVVAGDMLYLVWLTGVNGTATAPTGWAGKGSANVPSGTLTTCARRATGSEGSNVTLTASGFDGEGPVPTSNTAVVLKFSGGTGAVDITYVVSAASGTGTAISGVSRATTVANEMPVLVTGARGSTNTLSGVGGSIDQSLVFSGATPDNWFIWIGYKRAPSSTIGTTPPSATMTAASSFSWGAIQVQVQP